MDDRFRCFPQFDAEALRPYVRSKQRLQGLLLPLFPGDGLMARAARALIEARAVSLKELLESFELHHRTRRRLRAPVVADLFCGHGLTGMLFALTERQVERVILVDRAQPQSFEVMREALGALAPWLAEKVDYQERDVRGLELPSGCSVLAVHACGLRTDMAIEVAAGCGGAVALLPCCYRSAPREGPPVRREQLGAELAIDIDRTYRMEALGLQVDWAAIPRAISPMNRLMVGWRP